MNEINTGQIFLIQTEGPQDGLNSTEVVITDLGHLGDEAIVVLEEAVGVGAEETVNGGPVAGNGLVSLDDGTTGTLFHSNTDDLHCFSEIKYERSDDLVSPDLGVHYETVETSSLDPTTETVIFRVNYDEDSNSFTSVGGATSPNTELYITQDSDHKESNHCQHLVKTKSKRTSSSKLINSDLSKMYLCKLCNSYVEKALMKTHNRNVHQDCGTLTCSDCGKLFTSKRSLFGHKKEKHSGHTQVFICPDCNKQFSRKSNLKAHRESLHFGKKFPCRVCDRIFTNRSSMNQHFKKTHIVQRAPGTGQNLGTASLGALDVVEVEIPSTDQQLNDLMNNTGAVDLAILDDSVDPLDTGDPLHSRDPLDTGP